MLRASLIAFGIVSLSIPATSAAQANPQRNNNIDAAALAGGAYGAPGSEFGRARFVIYRRDDSLIVEDQNGRREHRPDSDGAFIYTETATGSVSTLRVLSPNAVEYTVGSSQPLRLVRVGDAGSWEDYATRVNLGLIEYYKRKTAELQAQRAAEAEEKVANSAPEPSTQQPMGAGFLDELNAMNRRERAETERSRQRLERTVANMEGGNAPSSSGGGNNYSSSAGSSYGSASSAHSMTRKTMQVYFWIGTTPRIATKLGEVDDGHNTHCQSNVFNVTIDWDPSLEASGGNLKYANPVLDGMKSAFIDKCNRADPSRPTEGLADWYADAFSGWNPPPALRTGDQQVTMP